MFQAIIEQAVEQKLNQAIKLHQGEILKVGTVCAHPSDNSAYNLIGYDKDIAILAYGGIIKRFPANEIFDVNKVRKILS